jgi:hypothetical protein
MENLTSFGVPPFPILSRRFVINLNIVTYYILSLEAMIFVKKFLEDVLGEKNAFHRQIGIYILTVDCKCM